MAEQPPLPVPPLGVGSALFLVEPDGALIDGHVIAAERANTVLVDFGDWHERFSRSAVAVMMIGGRLLNVVYDRGEVVCQFDGRAA